MTYPMIFSNFITSDSVLRQQTPTTWKYSRFYSSLLSCNFVLPVLKVASMKPQRMSRYPAQDARNYLQTTKSLLNQASGRILSGSGGERVRIFPRSLGQENSSDRPRKFSRSSFPSSSLLCVFAGHPLKEIGQQRAADISFFVRDIVFAFNGREEIIGFLTRKKNFLIPKNCSTLLQGTL